MKIVFFGPEESIIEKMLMDIKQSDLVEYNSFSTKKLNNSTIMKNLFRQKILKLLPNSIKKQLFKKFFANDSFFKKKCNDSVLIIFINTFELFGEETFWVFISFLKDYYKNNLSLAFFYYAVIDYCYPDLFPKVKENFDLVMSFDRYSSDKYKTVFYGPICEKGFVQPTDDCEESDVFFSGNHAGGVKSSTERLDLLGECFQFLSDNRKKCIFFIDGCSHDDKKNMFTKIESLCDRSSELIMNNDCIKYRNSFIYFQYIPYAKSLGYTKKTKAILEIGSPSDKGCIYTARVAQALGEEKKLITNAAILKNEKFYNESNCIVFEKISDIDVNRIDTPFEKLNYNFSGMALIEFIKKKLFD